MGVTGAGKTTVGRLLAAELRWAFVDADDLHPPANRRKMASGHPLGDDDRWPWLRRVRREIEAHLERVGGRRLLGLEGELPPALGR